MKKRFERFRLLVISTVMLLMLPIGTLIPAEPASARHTGDDQEMERAVEHVREHGIRVSDPSELDPLFERAGEHRLALLGEASHGTSEYYYWRAEISKKLIEDYGFDYVIVEGDWPLAFSVNVHVKHLEDEPRESRQVLSGFHRWPQWMWANEEVLDLIKWMHEYNSDRPLHRRAGFYGMDIYAHEEGMEDVISFLEENDPPRVRQARNYYGCFGRHPDRQSYLRSVHNSGEHCGDDLEAVHEILAENKQQYITADSTGFVNAWQASRMVVFAERHIRGNLRRGPDSWNHRVDHFYDATEQLLERYGESSRGIVWAHNTHIGDARATEMSNAGMRNIGQIARQELGEDQVFAIGFGTYKGEVLAGHQWEGRMERMQIPGAVEGSYEDIMQRSGISPLLMLFDDPEDHQPLMESRGNRAVGVVYDPRQDATQNFVNTVMPLRYDAFIFFEETEALTPFE